MNYELRKIKAKVLSTCKRTERRSDIFATYFRTVFHLASELDNDFQNILKRAALAMCLNLAILTFAVPSAHAQNTALGIYPPLLQITAETPSDIKSNIDLENQSDQTTNVNISIKAFTASNTENGQIELSDNFSSFPDLLLINRIQIFDQGKAVQSLTLSPKQKKTLVMEIILPKNEPRGDYYFSVLFVSQPSSNTISNSTLNSGGIATNVLLSVGPVGPTSGFIKEFSAPFFVDKGPLVFSVSIDNSSDHFITPTGDITITDMFGKTVGKVKLLPLNILAGSARKFTDSAQASLDLKDYQKIASIVEKNTSPVAVWPENFLLGPYKATLTVNLSSSGPVFKKSISFFAFPITYLLGILIIILIIIFIVLRIKKNNLRN